ncbi:hypothetical protein LTR85_007210 [Meristemomyces frigidus]|nr:hypothetical protein LTR85_007210 [Meristemomyces frigidus]
MPGTATSMDGSIGYVKEEYQCIMRLANTSRNLGEVPASSGISKKWYDRLDKFLAWLETDVRMTPELKESSVLATALQTIYARDKYHFPQAYAERAKALYERWESEKWGSGETIKSEDAEMDDAPSEDSKVPRERTTPSARRDSAAPVGGVKPGTIKLPPRDHSIWGIDGIMHGVAMKIGEGNKKGIVLDPRYERRNAKVHGHNGIEVGTWYPRQLVALFHGAHGHQQAGISGDRHTGAFSVVVSGQYDLLDQDRGDHLYYSGSRNHDNENPREPAPSAPGTMALHTSLETGKPVRVLRGSPGKTEYAPSAGLRYDGLYTVTSVSQPKNGKGGLYEQFELQRMEGQGEINKYRTNPREIRHEQQINQVNTSRWEVLQSAD